MGWVDWFCETFEFFTRGHNTKQLGQWLQIPVPQLREISVSYRQFPIPKRSGKPRIIHAPNDHLKQTQRVILRRLLRNLRSHPAAVGFEKGRSIVTGARQHVGKAVVLHFDVVDFFPNTSADQVYRYFRAIGWNLAASKLLVRLVTHNGALPQGAPTSPRLSNLVNYLLDERLTRLCDEVGASYTRYADDITISSESDWFDLNQFTRVVFSIVYAQGYRLHVGRKMKIRRRSKRQTVNGLVVNEKVNLPREKRRWLRAVKHRAKMHWDWHDSKTTATSSLGVHPKKYFTKRPTITQSQFEGWIAFEKMIQHQRNPPPEDSSEV